MKIWLKRAISIILLTLIFGFIIWAVFSWVYFNFVLPSEELPQTEIDQMKPVLELRGMMGDSFGAINSLFSGFAFAAVAISLYFQRREVRDAIEANDRTSRMMAAQTELSIKNAALSARIQLMEIEQRYDKDVETLAKERELKSIRAVLSEYIETLDQVVEDKSSWLSTNKSDGDGAKKKA